MAANIRDGKEFVALREKSSGKLVTYIFHGRWYDYSTNTAKQDPNITIRTTDNFHHARSFASERTAATYLNRWVPKDPTILSKIEFVRYRIDLKYVQVKTSEPNQAMSLRQKKNMLKKVEPRDIVRMRQEGHI